MTLLSSPPRRAKGVVHCQIVGTRTSASPLHRPSSRLSIPARDSQSLKIDDQRIIRRAKGAHCWPGTEEYLCQK